MTDLLRILGLFLLVGAVLSLLMPNKLGFFLKAPTRLKTFASYLGGMLLCALLAQAISPEPSPKGPQPAAVASTAQAPADPATPEPAPSAPSSASKPAPVVDAAALKAEFRSLYQELQSFRNKKTFHQRGFAEGGPYADWMHRATLAEDRFPRPMQASAGLIFGQLRQLGLDYMRSKGAGTELARDIEKDIKEALK